MTGIRSADRRRACGGGRGGGAQPLIELAGHAPPPACRRLLATLGEAYGVRFAPGAQGGEEPAGVLLLGAEQTPRTGADRRVPVLAMPLASQPRPRVVAVDLADAPPLDRRLHGLRLPDQAVGLPLELSADEEALACAGNDVLWSGLRGDATVMRVAAPLPVLADDETLRRALELRAPGRVLPLLALVHFIRAVVGCWAPTEMRAAFVFDDPNLRRPTYGHIDFTELVAHADAHGYHASMAMVPLDARAAHRRAAALFQTRPDRLSLVVHGNEHVRGELLQPPDPDAASALCAQALRRMARFEATTGLRVDRVMMPPHGLCSRTVSGALAAVGFDALCAIHPCPWTEDAPPDRPLAGWMPAEFIDGCAVVPRCPFGVSDVEIALRAFLDQPLVLYGHHGDLAAGLDVLAEAAARVNRLGAVRWCSPGEIVLANYAVATDAGTVAVRPWAGRIRVAIPQDATELTVLAPPGGERAGLSGWSLAGVDHVREFGSGVPVHGGTAVELRLRPRRELDPTSVPAPAPRLWPRVRRHAAEARDRLAPLRGAGR